MTAPVILVEHDGNERAFDGRVTIGGRLDNDIVLADSMVADRHCVIEYGDGFQIRDLGSVTGTWVDGSQARPALGIDDGSAIIIGHTRLRASITRDGTATALRLVVDDVPFHWRKPGKGVFDNDPDELVRSEVGFGRFPLLHAANRVALVAAGVLLIAGTFVTAAVEWLADPGPLLPAHAAVMAASAAPPPAAGDGHANFARCATLAGEQGCNVCHITGRGTPEARCRQCHGLPGEMAGEGSFRHPYHNDGQLGAVERIAADQQFCVLCHTDHQGQDWLKSAATGFVGQCGACHGAEGEEPAALRARLVERAPLRLPPPIERPFAALRFPHDAHLRQEIDCTVCHQLDPETETVYAAGAPTRSGRRDFAAVPYSVCASCHVPEAPLAGMTAAQRDAWRPTGQQWPTNWHGTADDGSHCRQCHVQTDRGGGRVFGPELRAIERPQQDAERYAAERARYRSPAQLHADQFAAHAGGAACTSCHKDGRIHALEPRPERPFWHALHIANGSLQPRDATRAAAISIDANAGCASCHAALAASNGLLPAAAGAFHWPETTAAIAACSGCHRDGEGRALPLTAVAIEIPDDRRVAVPEFPHDVHMASAAYGRSGTLAAGCFACHEFERPAGAEAFQTVPRTRPEARSCLACHTGHDNIGGGSCQQCHPKEPGRSNSFLLAAGLREPALPTRAWPAPTGFRHTSPGHRGPDLTCTTCHGGSGLERAATLADVRVPDESAPLCRDCHLDRQFHWR